MAGVGGAHDKDYAYGNSLSYTNLFSLVLRRVKYRNFDPDTAP